MKDYQNIENMLVLITDDTRENLLLVSNIIRSMKLQILLSTTGEKTLEYIDKTIPDLIILDIMMPEMDGFETCRRLKERPETADVPVIFISALSDISDKMKGFAAGGVDFISKPFEAEEIKARVRTHLTIRKQQQYLKNIIDQRDKILSILENDMKSSIGSLHSIVDLLLDNANEFSTENLMLIKLFDRSIGITNSLLENLITLSPDRHSSLNLNLKETEITELLSSALLLSETAAKQKNIEIIKNFEPDIKANCDPDMISALTRNLMTSVIKTADSNTKIEINASMIDRQIHLNVKCKPSVLASTDDLFMILTARRRANTATPGNIELKMCKEIIGSHFGEMNIITDDTGNTIYHCHFPDIRQSE